MNVDDVCIRSQRSHPACKHGHNYLNEHQVSGLYFNYKCCFHRPCFCTCANFLNGSWTSNLKTSVSNQAQRLGGLGMKLEWPGNEGGVAWERGCTLEWSSNSSSRPTLTEIYWTRYERVTLSTRYKFETTRLFDNSGSDPCTCGRGSGRAPRMWWFLNGKCTCTCNKRTLGIGSLFWGFILGFALAYLNYRSFPTV